VSIDLLEHREYYLIAYSVVANIVLASVYRRRPVVAMYICLVNVVLVAWFVMRTDRYNEKKLIGQCESSTLL
jgi:Flp pilus assembly protein TadB